MRYLALLRGINVGGKNILPMEKLRSVLSEAGFENVRTYIQSGNVVFDARRRSSRMLERAIEAALKKRGFDVKARVLTASEIDKVVRKAPALFSKDKKTHLCDVLYLMSPLTPAKAIANMTIRDGVDTATAGPGVVYSTRLKVKASKSGLSRITQTAAYQHMTIRNWNTTKKLSVLLREGR